MAESAAEAGASAEEKLAALEELRAQRLAQVEEKKKRLAKLKEQKAGADEASKVDAAGSTCA